MKAKDMQIIEVGMRLFASKGFSATSVQEIASESGISKGAFYLHFKSKDDLLLAILQHHFDMIHKAFSEVTKDIQNPRDKLIREQMALYSHFITHRELLVMLAKEQAIPRNDTIKQLLFEKQMESHQHYRKRIIEIYGPEVEPFSWDITIILEGIVKSYMGVLLFSTHDFDLKSLTEFLHNRLDSIVKDIHKDKPFLTKDKAESILANFLFSDHPSMSNVLKNLEEEIEKLGSDELVITFQVLKEEIGKEKPRLPVIHGMLSNFDGYPTLDSYRSFISEYYSTK
ncbi:TetR/AcrR family transcriptional regulator [Metabacillus halosaccharovorans]|uniref:TetR/AcrR family transcriptional regulator n=1 Tax=Metabacillus halosaccharovorans TaxID=930124 RepID=A0ABT3DLJ1_9BACI|nr:MULTISPECIES: TetR/AcrR family transcriptional regulator [Bacillaceae]MBU7595211.1 TetR/AcrR family transcriptional regulator [Metabacillus halosaccharovorans]MCV9887921.1 TetR/AcrR family transcriptional regulator [Metabacillus halosaccharovorans]